VARTCADLWNDVAYSLVDIEGVCAPELLDKLLECEGVCSARFCGVQTLN